MAYYEKSVVIDLTPVLKEQDFAILSLQELDEISRQFNCLICLRTPSEAKICPKCGSIFGKACLQVAYKNFGGTECPHCR